MLCCLEQVQDLTDLFEEYAPYMNEYVAASAASKTKVNDARYTRLIDELEEMTDTGVNSFDESWAIFQQIDFEAADVKTRHMYDEAASKAADAHHQIHEAEVFLDDNVDTFSSFDEDFNFVWKKRGEDPDDVHDAFLDEVDAGEAESAEKLEKRRKLLERQIALGT